MKKSPIWEAAPALKLVAFARRVHRPAQRLYWHRHPFYELGLVLSGECDWRLGRRRGGRLSLQAGQGILLGPGTLHCEALRPGGRCSLAWIGFETGAEPPPWAGKAVALGDDFGEIRHACEAIGAEHHLPGGRSQTRIRLAVQTALLLFSRRAEEAAAGSPAEAKPRLNPRQVRAVESGAHYFRENLREPLSVAEVAAYQSLCPAHFAALFRRYYGVTPRDYLQRARLDKARELLREGDLGIKEIAARCGFGESAHFCRIFKKAEGVTPGECRRGVAGRLSF